MKRVFALCMAILMVLSLAACGSKSAPAADSKKWIFDSDTVFKHVA